VVVAVKPPMPVDGGNAQKQNNNGKYAIDARMNSAVGDEAVLSWEMFSTHRPGCCRPVVNRKTTPDALDG
jgi:hypothetical protein